MGRPREYQLIWKKGGWFENGHFALIPKQTFSEKLGEYLFVNFILLLISIFIGSIILFLSPIIAIIVCSQMTRIKRYWGGLISIILLIYLLIDLKLEWISSLLFYGWESDGEITGGIFGTTLIEPLMFVNITAALIGIYIIADSVLYGKKTEERFA